MLVTLTTGLTEHYDDEPFSQGGQGTLHLSRDGRWVIKLYHQGDQRRIPGLNKIIDDLNVTKSDPSVASLFAWPDAIVRAPRLGIRMPNVNQQIEHKPLTWWILPKALKHLPPDMRGTWLDRIYVAVNMARIAWQLHAYGLCHSDFSGDNFLANVARHHTVLIDLDSLVVPGVLLPEMLGTGDYMAPEIVSGRLKPAGKGAGKDDGAKPSIYTDLHSLAVLIYQLLLMRHPLKGPKKYADDAETDDLLALGPRALYIENADDPSNRPVGPFNGSWLLGEEVETLMHRAFTVGLRNPTQRPLAAEWGDALIRMIEQTVPCANPACEGKVFVLLRDRPAVCPWCGTKVPRPAQVPVLRMYDGAGQAGHFQPGRGRLVGWQQRTLHRWHVQAGYSERSAVTAEDRRPVAEFQFDQNKWLLTNLAIPELRVAMPGGVRRVAIDDMIALENGQQLILGADGQGKVTRLALVTMQKLR